MIHKRAVKTVDQNSHQKEIFYPSFFFFLYYVRQQMLTKSIVIIHNVSKSNHHAVYLKLEQWCMSIFSQRKKLEKTEKNAHSSTVHNSQTQAIPCMPPADELWYIHPVKSYIPMRKNTTNTHNLDDSWNIILSQRTSLKRIFCVRLTCKFQSRRGWYEVWEREEWQARA